MKEVQTGVVAHGVGLLKVIEPPLVGDVRLLERLHLEVDVALGAAAPLPNACLDLKQILP